MFTIPGHLNRRIIYLQINTSEVFTTQGTTDIHVNQWRWVHSSLVSLLLLLLTTCQCSQVRFSTNSQQQWPHIYIYNDVTSIPKTVYDSPANLSRPILLPAVLLGDGVALLMLGGRGKKKRAKKKKSCQRSKLKTMMSAYLQRQCGETANEIVPEMMQQMKHIK